MHFHTDEIICLWLDISTNCEGHPVPFEPVAAFFGIWHEHRRGNHRGLHEFYWESNYVLLLNVYDSTIHGGAYNGGAGAESTYRHLMPPTVKPIRQGKQFDKSLLVEMKRRTLHIQPVKAAKTGMNCNEVTRVNFVHCRVCWACYYKRQPTNALVTDLYVVIPSVDFMIIWCNLMYIQVCAAAGKQCNEAHLQIINTCAVLQESFPCVACKHSFGTEQPAFVSPQADQRWGPGECLVNAGADKSTCDAAHASTYRLCACD